MWWFLALTASYIAGLGGVATWATLSTQRRRLRTWLEAAASCGLEVVETPSPGVWRRLKLAARAASVEVLIQDSTSKSYSTLLVVKVPGPPGFTGMRLRRELHRTSPTREIEVGDETFDKTFSIEGPTRLVFALLGVEARRLLSDINAECPVVIGGGELRAGTYEGDVPIILPLLLDLAHRFAYPVDAAQRLSENALRDPLPGVRLRNLLLLARELPEDPRTVETLRAACSDGSPEIRLRAAMELGDEGRDALLEIVESDADDVWSAQALSVVGRELPFERTQAILIHALRRRRVRTARACLEALGHGGAAAVGVLAKVLAREQGELAAAAAQALGTSGSAAAEPPLIQALQRESLDVRAAAANALARVGSAAAVLPLKEAAERSDDNDLRRATRQAIGEIQSRARGASPGQLSLAGDETGQLSLAQAEAGQLSLAADVAGRVSFPSTEPGELSLSEAEEGGERKTQTR